MKKIVLLSVFLIGFIGISAQPLLEKISSFGTWSVTGEIGFSRFDGDLNPSFGQMVRGVFMSPSLGASVEYNINKNFGIGYAMGANIFNQEDVDERSSFIAFQMAPYFTADVLSIARGYKHPKWSSWFSVGFGFGGVLRAEYETTRFFVPDPVQGMVFPPVVFIAPLTYSVEYNINRNMAVGANAKFVFTNSDYLESIYRGRYEDNWQNVSLVYRYKFLPKDKIHLRDEEYEPDYSNAVLIRQMQEQLALLTMRMNEPEDTYELDMLAERVDSIEDAGRKINPMSDEMDQLRKRMQQLEDDLNKADGCKCAELDSLRARMMRMEDRMSGVQPMIIRETTIVQQTGDLPTGLASVYFDFDSNALDDKALAAIAKVAEYLKADPSLKLEVRGFADSPGRTAYNLEISKQRANIVKAELIQAHGIKASRISTNAKGQLPEPPVASRNNRRCDFIFSR